MTDRTQEDVAKDIKAKVADLNDAIHEAWGNDIIVEVSIHIPRVQYCSTGPYREEPNSLSVEVSQRL